MKDTLEKIASYINDYSTPVLAWGLVIFVPVISGYLAYEAFKNKKYDEGIAAASLAVTTGFGIPFVGIACFKQGYRRNNSYNSSNKL